MSNARRVGILLVLAACSKQAPADADAQLAAEVLGDVALVDASVDAAADVSPQLPPGPPLPSARGWKLARTVVHIHSAYSHDACDGEVSKAGTINQTCLAQLRAGLCVSGLDVAFMTDHPSTMNDRTFEQLLFFDASQGDQLVGPAGAPFANVIQCPQTATATAHELVVTAGFEATHLMPVGLHAHVTVTAMEGGDLSDAVTLSDARARVDMARAAGALVVNAHSEQDDISVQRLLDLGVDAMEIYNIHANFNMILGKSGSGSATGSINLPRIFELENFLGDPSASPDPNLLLLVMLDLQPEQAYLKWQQALAFKHVTGLLGNDVHQDVTLDAYCGPGGQFAGACDGFKDQYPHLVALLTNGGTPMLADGARVDSYPRMLQAISDRPLVAPGIAAADRPDAYKAALKAGRNWVVFDLLGEPVDFDFVAEKDGQFHEMGETLPVGTQLWLRTPSGCVPPAWAHWTLADTQNTADLTEIRTIVWYIAPGAQAAQNILEVKGFAGISSFTADKPGRYHLETRIIPRHLRKSLKALGDHADTEERWLVSNPIAIQ